MTIIPDCDKVMSAVIVVLLQTMLLTNDLTEGVMSEAVQRKVDLILSYHPPIFRPLKRLAFSKSWKVSLGAGDGGWGRPPVCWILSHVSVLGMGDGGRPPVCWILSHVSVLGMGVGVDPRSAGSLAMSRCWGWGMGVDPRSAGSLAMSRCWGWGWVSIPGLLDP